MDQELKDYLDRQKDHLERQFSETRAFQEETRAFQEETRAFQEETRAFQEETNLRFAAADRQFDELRDEVHKARILIEKLDDKIDLVAEGLQSNTEVMTRLFDENSQRFTERAKVVDSAHRHLEGRVSQHDTEIGALDQRVGRLEAARA